MPKKYSYINPNHAYHIPSALRQVQAIFWLGDGFHCSLAGRGKQLDPGPAAAFAAVEHVHCCFIVKLKLFIGDHFPVVTQRLLIYRVWKTDMWWCFVQCDLVKRFSLEAACMRGWPHKIMESHVWNEQLGGIYYINLYFILFWKGFCAGKKAMLICISQKIHHS